MGNYFIFPAPRSSYKISDYPDLLTHIERPVTVTALKATKKPSEIAKIPALYLRSYSRKSDYLIIYFHGNSEDLGRVFPKLIEYYENFQIDILAPEYAGYGIYNTRKSNGIELTEDAKAVLSYATSSSGLNYRMENVILIGLSMGSGLALYLASKFPNLRGVVTIAAFTSIREVSRHMAGKLLSKFVPDIFRNLDIVDQVRCPMLLIHGKMDTLIPFRNSVELHDKATGPKELVIIENMTHNGLLMEEIFERMLEFFLNKLDLKQHFSNLEDSTVAADRKEQVKDFRQSITVMPEIYENSKANESFDVETKNQKKS